VTSWKRVFIRGISLFAPWIDHEDGMLNRSLLLVGHFLVAPMQLSIVTIRLFSFSAINSA